MQVGKINNDYNYNRYNSVAFKKIVKNKIPESILENKKYVVGITGPSGIGKDTLVNMVIGNFEKIVTDTTRKMRPGEIDGVSYNFKTEEKFYEGIINNKYVEYIHGFGGKYYGTSKESMKKAINSGKPGLLIVDVDGARNIRNNLKNDPEIKFLSIFFEPPAIGELRPMDVLRQRLEGRGTESQEDIEERLSRAAYEIGCKDEFDAVISFENPDEGVASLKELLHLN